MIIKAKCYNYNKMLFTTLHSTEMTLRWWYYYAIHRHLVYANFYAKIFDWNFRLVDENSQILVVVFVSKLNFSFSFSFVDENCRIFVVVVSVTKINLFSSMKIFVFVVVDEKNTVTDANVTQILTNA